MSTSNMTVLSRIAVAILVLGVVALGSFWAGRTALTTVNPPVTSGDPTTYVVRVDTIGRATTFSGTVNWPAVGEAAVGRDGIVTTVNVHSPATVTEGEVLFTLDLRPVVVGEGRIPAFRDLTIRDEGEDVSQLQGLLMAMGYVTGDPDGRFGPTTVAAVRAWQADLGVKRSGSIARGDVLWLPSLPAEVRLTEAVAVGKQLSSGDVVVEQLAEHPVVSLLVSREQINLIPSDPPVRIGDNPALTGRLAEGISNESGVVYHVVDEAGDPICAAGCQGVPLVDGSEILIEVVFVPQATGPIVPVAAITTEPDGTATVTLEDGQTAEVEVIATTGGMSVVDGIEPGTVIRLPEPPSRSTEP